MNKLLEKTGNKPLFYQFFRKMKLTVLFTTLTILSCFSAESYSQSTRLTLNMNNTTLLNVIQTIEAESEFKFFYNEKVDINMPVTVAVEQKSITEILDKVLTKSAVKYKVIGRQIALYDKNEMEPSFNVQQPEKQISGTVTDQNGAPLAGVTVVIKGTTSGAVTDNDGKYLLNNLPQAPVLVFSFIGMKIQEVEAEGKSVIDIRMEEESIELGEVVAVGYGTQKKVNLTGAIGMVKGDALEKRPIANMGEGLQGIIPNLNITVRNGDPSSSPTFNIRGFTSINGGEPLVLVDNIPMDINRINPNDIESISVLKDAAAGAIYGARAAFGVILVETKKTKQGKMSISLNSQFGMAQPILNVNPIDDPYEYVTAWNKASIRTTGTPRYNEDMVEGARKWSENPNVENAWNVKDGVLQFFGNNNYRDKLITDFAPTQQHDIAISGGSEKSSYYSSIGFFRKEGYLRSNNTDFQRYNILMKADYHVNKWLSLNEQIIFNSQNNDSPTEYNWDVHINSIARVGTLMPIQFPDLPHYITPGDHEKYEPYIGKYFGGTNFFPYLMEGGRETYTNNDLWLTSGITLKPFKGFKAVSNFSYQIFNRSYKKVNSKVDIVSADLLAANPITNDYSNPDFIVNENQFSRSYVFNAYGEYNVDFSNHHLTATMGFNQEWSRYQTLQGTAYSLITSSVPNLHATTGSKLVDGADSHVALRGAFYRLNYNYKERYLFEANGRYDGSSRFPKDGRFGFFPSFSGAWRISNESFMAGTQNWLNNLKVRASYGVLGNQLLGTNYYPYIPTMNSGIPSTYPIILSGTTPAINILWPNLVSPTLTWEKVISKNIGLDIWVLKSRLDMSFDMYTRDTEDMLMSRTYPGILGAISPKENAADLRTQGWELSLTWRDKIKTDFSYDVTIGLSDWTSKITKYENPGGNISDYYVGKKIGEIWGFETAGIFQKQEDITNAPDQSQIGNNWRPGDIQYANLDNDAKITRGSNTLDDHGDLKIIGNTTPRYQFGINIGMKYKNWGLTSFFQGVGKRDIWPSTNSWTWFYPFNSSYLESSAMANSWSEDNTDAYFPAPSVASDTGEKKNYQVQSRFLQDGAYVRLKNIMLSYDLPRMLLDRLNVSNIQIYLAGMNLWEYSKIRKPLDPESIPEITSGTVGAIEFPMQRLYTLGAKISF